MEMEKDFDNWNLIKKTLELKIYKNKELLFKIAEIWWCSIGINIAKESCGKGDYFRRPVLILQKLSNKHFIGLSISRTPRVGSWFHPIKINGEIQYVSLHQIRMFSTKRLQRHIGTITQEEFSSVKEKTKHVLGFF